MVASAPFTTDARARIVLGALGDRLPASVVVADHVAMAHASVLDRLRDHYGNDLPAFTGDGLEVVSWAEAKLAAASILSTLLLRLPEADRAAIGSLRDEAAHALAAGVPGHPIGGLDPDGAGPALTLPSGPSVTRGDVRSLFADPYAETGPAVRLVDVW